MPAKRGPRGGVGEKNGAPLAALGRKRKLESLPHRWLAEMVPLRLGSAAMVRRLDAPGGHDHASRAACKITRLDAQGAASMAPQQRRSDSKMK